MLLNTEQKNMIDFILGIRCSRITRYTYFVGGKNTTLMLQMQEKGEKQRREDMDLGQY